MKKIFINTTTSILSIILILSVSSCSKERSESGVNGVSSEKIRITGVDANTTTKTTLNGLVTSWIQTTDKVGIYCAESTGGNVNIPYTASSTAFSSAFSGDMKWGTGTHNFYAYYPYLAGSEAATVVPITLAAAQTQSAGNNSSHLSALDFLVATPKTVVTPGTTGNPTTVDLRYNHVFTVLEFQIKGTGQLKAVKLSANNTLAFSSGTIDITQSTPATDVSYTFASQTGTTTEAVVTLTTPATLTANNTDTKVYMVINPGTQVGNCTIGLSSDGINYLTISKEAPSGGFLRGKKYVVAIDKATAVATAPDAPIIGTATMGDTRARVTFTAPNNGGSVITSYTATSSPGGLTGSSTAGSITVTGLTNGTAYTFTVKATNTIGTSLASSASNSITPLVIPVVTSSKGKIWMDRNLGASQVATSSTDAAAYGDLYQWGRGTDGHQIRTSGTTSTLSGTDVPGHANFILDINDWRSTQNTNLWQGENGVNNPCPSGFRVPTWGELDEEMDTWNPQTSASAFGSPLKFTLAGLRIYWDVSPRDFGSYGYYWSSTAGGTYSSHGLSFSSSNASTNNFSRARGHSVRCIKD